MNVLVVMAHPNPKSLTGSFLQSTINGLKENPKVKQIDVLDLYKEGFDPLLVFNENIRRRDMHTEPTLNGYRDQLKKADMIVFLYPIWWGRPPAMLLGYFDRLFATDFAFKNHPGKLLAEGLLKEKQVVCISTMKGPQGYLQYWLYNSHRILIRKALMNFVGIKKVRIFEFGNMESKGNKQEKRLNQIYKFMSQRNFQQKVKQIA